MNVAIIPARGGSRRIPRKNIRDFHGKPIIAYSIEAARASGLFADIFVSTEDTEIAGVALNYGARLLLRDPGMSKDSVGTQDVMADALRGLLHNAMKIEPWAFAYTEIEYVCCIYPCAPMLLPEDLRIGYAVLGKRPAFPYAYVPGIFYWGQADAFLCGVPLSSGFEIPFSAVRYIDINTEEDWLRAERMYAELYTADPYCGGY